MKSTVVELKYAHSIFDTLHSIVKPQNSQNEQCKMIAQFLLILSIFTFAVKCEENHSGKTELAEKPRFYIEGDSYTINLIPFFVALKIAFVLGKTFIIHSRSGT